ncbi:MAG: hypothetical protein LBM93_15170 [Oscillospiraceae bacterium]|jgi:hypothetical protein|nr:hypothetical protein [Oscillospiraceae bacterium]
MNFRTRNNNFNRIADANPVEYCNAYLRSLKGWDDLLAYLKSIGCTLGSNRHGSLIFQSPNDREWSFTKCHNLRSWAGSRNVHGRTYYRYCGTAYAGDGMNQYLCFRKEIDHNTTAKDLMELLKQKENKYGILTEYDIINHHPRTVK